MHSVSISKSTFATSTSTTTSQNSQSGMVDGQRPTGSFMDLSTAVHTPESCLIPTNYNQQDGMGLWPELGLWSEMRTTQTNPFEALATHITATFDDRNQGQSASSLSLSNEPSRSQRSSQLVNDVVPIVREEPSPDPTDKWITMSGDKKRPFRCGYKGCGRKYSIKAHLQTHFATHIGDSKLRCHLGDCSGTVIHRSARELTRHIHAKHTLERIFGCGLCDKQFRRTDHLRRHMEYVHLIKSKKKSLERHSVSESPSATTATITASTSTMTSRVSQPELAAWQRPQGSFADLPKTVHTPQSTHIPEADEQFSGLRLLANVSFSQTDPFEALTTHQTVIFNDEAVTTGIAEGPNLPSFQHLAEQSPDLTDTNKWIIVDKSQKKPYRCGYPGCDKGYIRKDHLKGHFLEHTGKSEFKCPYPECAGYVYFRYGSSLKRHMLMHTSERPFQCDICERRFGRKDHLRRHRKDVHGNEEEKKSPKRK